MSLKLKRDIFDTPSVEMPLDGSTAVTDGDLLYRDLSNKVVKVATSSVGSSLTLVGVAMETVTSGATQIDMAPIVPNMGQLWEADCTNNTASDQLLLSQPLTNASTIANTNSDTATTLGVFVPIKTIGAAGDKKLLGYFVLPGQVTA